MAAPLEEVVMTGVRGGPPSLLWPGLPTFSGATGTSQGDGTLEVTVQYTEEELADWERRHPSADPLALPDEAIAGGGTRPGGDAGDVGADPPEPEESGAGPEPIEDEAFLGPIPPVVVTPKAAPLAEVIVEAARALTTPLGLAWTGLTALLFPQPMGPRRYDEAPYDFGDTGEEVVIDAPPPKPPKKRPPLAFDPIMPPNWWDLSNPGLDDGITRIPFPTAIPRDRPSSRPGDAPASADDPAPLEEVIVEGKRPRTGARPGGIAPVLAPFPGVFDLADPAGRFDFEPMVPPVAPYRLRDLVPRRKPRTAPRTDFRVGFGRPVTSPSTFPYDLTADSPFDPLAPPTEPVRSFPGQPGTTVRTRPLPPDVPTHLDPLPRDELAVDPETDPRLYQPPARADTCACEKPRPRKKRTPRTDCYRGTYVETSRGLSKTRKEKISCR